jgi:hypothetical protein
MGGTPDFLMDPSRGLYSYSALQSRLAENSYATNGLVDYTGPVIRLANLSPEDFYVLLTKLRNVQAGGDPANYSITDDGIRSFMGHCATRIGDSYFRTPRNSIKGFLDLLAVLEQNPEQTWSNLIPQLEFETESNPDLEPLPETDIPDNVVDITSGATRVDPPQDDELTSFRL